MFCIICFKVIERELVANTVDGTSAPIEEPIPTLSWPPEAFDNTSGEEDSLLSIGAASISMMNKSGKVTLVCMHACVCVYKFMIYLMVREKIPKIKNYFYRLLTLISLLPVK